MISHRFKEAHRFLFWVQRESVGLLESAGNRDWGHTLYAEVRMLGALPRCFGQGGFFGEQEGCGQVFDELKGSGGFSRFREQTGEHGALAGGP